MKAVEWFAKQVLEYKSPTNINGTDYILIPVDKIEFLQEQAKEMEKEQMCGFAEFVATYPDKNKNINGEMLHAKSKYDGAERTVDLLEEYYEDNN